jgi:tetratricopeptide (TPR) repeat protein
MRTSSLAWLLLLLMRMAVPVVEAEEILPEQEVSHAEYKKAWSLFYLADAHFTLGEYREGIEAAKSAFRILRDVRMLTQVALIYENWGAHVSDPKEALRLKQQAMFLYERAELLLPTVARGAPRSWVRLTLDQRLPPLKEQLAKADKHAKKSRHRPAQRVAELEAEMARIRDELVKERSLRTGLEQAVRVLASRKQESCAGP